jgi:hypothetical protein
MVLMYETGCNHGRHDKMWPHVHGYSLFVFSGCLFRHHFYDVVQEAGRQRHTFSRIQADNDNSYPPPLTLRNSLSLTRR